MRTGHPHESGVTLVELLVVMVIFGIISASITGVLITAQRSEQFQGEMQEVMDDARLSFQRIRREVRAARDVLATSCVDTTVDGNGDYTGSCTPTGTLHMWVDQNQDAIRQDAEIVCYFTEAIGPGQYQLVRWPDATAGCDASNRPATVSVLAQTLVDPLPFAELDPLPYADPARPSTNSVVVRLDLEVLNLRGPTSRVFESTIRLRNVA